MSTKPRLSLLQRMNLANSGKQSGSLHRGPLPPTLQRLTGTMPSLSLKTSGLPWASLACMVSVPTVLCTDSFSTRAACVTSVCEAVEASASTTPGWLAWCICVLHNGQIQLVEGCHCTLQV